jgi:competence protein ComEA
MLKKIFAALAALLLAAAAHAAIDVNRASQAELEAIKGIGPSLSTRIMSERGKTEFKDWSDFVGRTKGVGEKNAAKFSEAGLTVQGKPFVAPPAADAKPTKAKGSAGKKEPGAQGTKKTRERGGCLATGSRRRVLASLPRPERSRSRSLRT